MHKIGLCAIAILLFIALGAATTSQQVKNTEARIIEAVRVEVPPKIDGVLDDECWVLAIALVEPVTGFIQRKPDEFQPAKEQTYVYVTYDKDNIYIAFHCLESTPDKIVAKITSRDALTALDSRSDVLSYDDAVQVLLDTYRDGRNYYSFMVNTISTQADAKSNGGVLWDWVWDAEAQINDEGWSAEMAIPFNALQFKSAAGEQTWGINFLRSEKPSGEETYWSRVGDDISNPRGYGILTGLKDLPKESLRVDYDKKLGQIVARMDETGKRLDHIRYILAIVFSVGIALGIAGILVFWFLSKRRENQESEERLRRIEEKLERKLDQSKFDKWSNAFSKDFEDIARFVDQLDNNLRELEVPENLRWDLRGSNNQKLLAFRKIIFRYNHVLKGISAFMKTTAGQHFQDVRCDKVEPVLDQIDTQLREMRSAVVPAGETEGGWGSIQKLSQSLSALMAQFKFDESLVLQADEDEEADIPEIDLKSLTRTFARYIDDELKESREHEEDVEEKFQELLKISGLEQIKPQKGERLNLRYHEIEGEQRSDVPRRSIVSTVVRGFIDGNDIWKAKVIIAS